MTKIFWASPWIPFKGKRREGKGKRERRAASPNKNFTITTLNVIMVQERPVPTVQLQ
jgi:hypothetical protein